MSSRHVRPRLPAVGAGAILIAALAGCGSPGATAPESGGSTPVASAPSAAGQHSPVVTLESGWVKAGSDMTAAFGTVHNGAAHPVTLVNGATSVAASLEVHTMVKQPDGSMTMTEKEGGLVVPANGSVTLAPGGDHLMLLGLHQPLVNGGQVSLVMTSDSGEHVTWTVPVRSFAGAEETYAPEAGATSTPDPGPSHGGMATTGSSH